MTLDKEKFPVRATWEEDGFTVEIEGGETVVLNTDWTVGEPMMLADIGGKEVTVQVGGGAGRHTSCQHIILSILVAMSIQALHNT